MPRFLSLGHYAAIALFFVSTYTQATALSFNLEWVGFEEDISASAMLSIDDEEIMTNETNTLNDNPAYLVDFMLTIDDEDESITFNFSDFNEIILSLSGEVDFTTDLVTQINFSDFNVFSGDDDDIPNALSPNVFAFDDELYLLTSFTPKDSNQNPISVPEPHSALLLAFVLAAFGYRRRKMG